MLRSRAGRDRLALLVLLAALGAAEPQKAPADAESAILKAGCGGCHTIPAVPGAAGLVGPDLSEIGVHAGARRAGYSADAYLRESILEPDAFIAPACPSGSCFSGVMLKSFARALAPGELDAIVRYLSSLGTGQPIAAPTEKRVALQEDLPAESRAPSFAPRPGRLKPAEVALGKSLFFDSRLSGNRSLSCASCHDPEQAWSDGLRLSRGYPETAYFRNTPSVLNAGLKSRLYWDGRMDGRDLPTVVRDHLTEAHFMNMDGRLASERLRQVPAYVQRFEALHGVEPRFGGIINSLAAYVQTLVSGPTPYDDYQAGDRSALSREAVRGLGLFEGKAGCAKCHTGPLLSDGKFHDTGLRSDAALLDDPRRAVTFRRFFRTLGVPAYRSLLEDPGLYALTKEGWDRNRFRTPSVREVARTAPYMHDGRLATLEQVVEFYDAGGGIGNKSNLRPLGLSAEERSALVAFLRSLSSTLPSVDPPELPAFAVYRLAESDSEPSEKSATRADVSPEEYPALAPLPPPPAPRDNPPSEAKVALGRLLYFDPRMSGDGSLSCSSCHPPATGWGAPGPLSFGYPGTVHWRNASTILNVAYYSKLNWDGAAPSIEAQNKGAWTGAVAGNLDPIMAEERLAQIPEYVQRFRTAFGTEVPRFEDALRAVASYQRTLNSRDVPFDEYLRGNADAIGQSARRGLDLFRGKAGCIACHNGALLSDEGFYALGVPMHPDFYSNPLRQITFRWEQWVKGANERTYRTATEDYGLYYITKQESDKGKFRTPGLRDVCYTGPYMHNGVLATLSEVIAFYDGGGGPHPNKDPRIRPLALSEPERADLVEFLESLCGQRIVEEAPELPAYAAGPQLVAMEDAR